MRLLFIRHGDPDYEHDTLTPKGHVEARFLSEYIENWNIGTAYVSPLGRAQHTAGYSLQKLNKQAVTLSWLQEFPALIDINGSDELIYAYPDCHKKDDIYQPRIVWDVLPGYFSTHPEYWSVDGWRDSEIAKRSNIVELYDAVIADFEDFLAEHGYRRNGWGYHVEKESEETLTFFCHFGLTCVILSRLWNISPFILWHSLAMAPTSVTEVVSEEREQGIASFRALKIGDITHLNIGQEPPSFACRFCETYSNPDQRH